MSKFNWFQHKGTQNLYRKQFRKVIKRFGFPVYYVKKKESGSSDKLYGEDMGLSYTEAFPMKLYLESFEFYDGENQTFNNFLSILDDSVRWKIDVESFKEATGMNYPEEGDIIALALSPELSVVEPNQKSYELFEIKGVDPRNDFYQFGTFFSHVLNCTRFEYNHQRFQTGIPEIDIVNEITDKPEENIIGDNDYIDDLNVNGIEQFNPVTGEIEDGDRPVVEENECNPMKNDPVEVTWDPNNPYGEE